NGQADISFEEDIVFGDFPDTVHMRIATDGTDVWGEYSTDDGESFTKVGRTWSLEGLEAAEIGVFALNSPSTTSRVMAFDWFRVTEGSEPVDTTPPEVSATLDGEQNDDGDYVGV